MNNYKNWPDGAVEIRKTDDTHIMRFFNKYNEALCSVGWCPSEDYETTIATREPEPENKGYQLADGSWSSEYEVGKRFRYRFSGNKEVAHYEYDTFVELVDYHDGMPVVTSEFVNTEDRISFVVNWLDLWPVGYRHTPPPPLPQSTNTKNLEFMCACYERGLSYIDAIELWELKNT